MFQASGSGDSYTEDRIKALIDERNKARREKNWKEADRIRDYLLKAGIELLDSSEGTKWRLKE
jgi:cysteinyl-tRNA synthetase